MWRSRARSCRSDRGPMPTPLRASATSRRRYCRVRPVWCSPCRFHMIPRLQKIALVPAQLILNRVALLWISRLLVCSLANRWCEHLACRSRSPTSPPAQPGRFEIQVNDSKSSGNAVPSELQAPSTELDQNNSSLDHRKAHAQTLDLLPNGLDGTIRSPPPVPVRGSERRGGLR